jgi:membrane associated rhomboid family serine protease
LYLWIFGNNVEDRFGPMLFAAFYLTCGVVASIAQAVATPTAAVPTIGASGAIAGVLAGYLLLFPGTTVVTLIPIFFFIQIARLPAYVVIGFWFVLQVGSGLASIGRTADAGGVAWFAHIGGFVTGLVLAAPAAVSARRRRALR